MPVVMQLTTINIAHTHPTAANLRDLLAQESAAMKLQMT